MSANKPIAEVKKTYPIGYVALATGLSPHVIRVWERRYQAVAPEREGKGRRFYSQSDIDRLERLKRARRRGRRIGSVVMLDEETLQRMDRDDELAFDTHAPKIERAERSESQSGILRACESAVRNMDALRLSLTLRRADAHLPRSALLTDVVAPLMRMVGDEWCAQRLGIMHEHLASNVVRGFLSEVLDRRTINKHAPAMLLTTPAGQHCELGALTAAVTAADLGWRVYYFGPDLPNEEIAAAAALKRSEAVCLSVTCRSQRGTLARELKGLRQQLGDEVRLLIGGQAASACRQAVTASNFHVFSNLSEFADFISRPGLVSEASTTSVRSNH